MYLSISAVVYDQTESRESLRLRKCCTAAHINGSLIASLAQCSDTEAERRLRQKIKETEGDAGRLQKTAAAASRENDLYIPTILKFARDLGQARRQALVSEDAFTPRRMDLQVTEHITRQRDNKDCYRVCGYRGEGAGLDAGPHTEYSWSEFQQQLDTACKAFVNANSVLTVAGRPQFPKDRAGLMNSKKPPQQRLQDLQDYARRWMEWDSALREQKGFALCGIRAVRSFLGE